MGFQCGIVGLPNVGKSTIFNAITAAGAASENYPFCTIEPNVGRVDVPDPRLERLAAKITTQRVLPAAMEFVDIAGLVAGASRGEGLGNKFLGHIRSTQAIAHVVRCFEDPDVLHVAGSPAPLRDIDIIESELVFADAETVCSARERYGKRLRAGGRDTVAVADMLDRLSDHLQQLRPARLFSHPGLGTPQSPEAVALRDLHLLTSKPVVFVCNVDEDLASGTGNNPWTEEVRRHAAAMGAQVVLLSGKIESEVSALGQDERSEMLAALGLGEAGLRRLIRAGYALLGLETYFTVGEKEIRAWTIPRATKAPQAAGVIHSDFERGFICAEVCTVDDLLAAGSKARLKESGLLRIEGRDYVVRDGDVMEFRFNV